MSRDAREVAVLFEAASVLLQYPDESTRQRLPVVASALERLPKSDARSGLTSLCEHITASPDRELSEHYVSFFDRRRRCCLYLTWWIDGETRRRGQSLADLKVRYRKAGLELEPGELPDFLPVVLEYAALGDLADGL